MNSWSVVALPLMSAMALFTFGCKLERGFPSVELGDVAPTFALTDVLSGKIVTSDSLNADVIVVAFWSTTCADCIREIEELKSIQEMKNASVVAIALDDDQQRVRRFIAEKDVNYQVLLGDQETFERFDGFNIPYAIVIDSERTIRKKFRGPIMDDQFQEAYDAICNPRRVALRESM